MQLLVKLALLLTLATAAAAETCPVIVNKTANDYDVINQRSPYQSADTYIHKAVIHVEFTNRSMKPVSAVKFNYVAIDATGDATGTELAMVWSKKLKAGETKSGRWDAYSLDPNDHGQVQVLKAVFEDGSEVVCK